MKSDLADVDVEFLYQTEKAILLVNLKNKQVWLPKSQCEINQRNPKRHATVILTAQESLLIDKEFI